MIEIGSLVRSTDDGCVGIITWCDDPNNDLLPSERIYKVAWADHRNFLHCDDEFEVLS
jgi:hypothetical protein